jgi:hypothetical protein
VDPRAGLDTEARGKIHSPLLGIEPRSPGRPARSQTLYCLSYPAHSSMTLQFAEHTTCDTCIIAEISTCLFWTKAKVGNPVASRTRGELTANVRRHSQHFCNLSDKRVVKFRIKFSKFFFKFSQFVSLFASNRVVRIYMFWKKNLFSVFKYFFLIFN